MIVLGLGQRRTRTFCTDHDQRIDYNHVRIRQSGFLDCGGLLGLLRTSVLNARPNGSESRGEPHRPAAVQARSKVLSCRSSILLPIEIRDWAAHVVATLGRPFTG